MCPQSLSRRSPTAPFAQGRRLCCPGNNRPWFCCPVREHRSPPCAKGGQHANPMQGGLTALSCLDDTRCRVWLSLARCRQSLSRRSPTAPFAQGRSGGRTAILSLVRCPDGHTFFAFLRTTGPARERSMGAAARRQRGSAVWVQRHAGPAWGAKKVGEKLSFSPRASGGVTYRNDGYFGFTPK